MKNTVEQVASVDASFLWKAATISCFSWHQGCGVGTVFGTIMRTIDSLGLTKDDVAMEWVFALPSPSPGRT